MEKINISDILSQIGEDALKEDLGGIPTRFENTLKEMLFGYKIEKESIFNGKLTNFNDGGIILFEDVEFFSMCKHHLMPFVGKITIAYIPNNFIVGFHSILKLIEAVTRRLQLQEEIVSQIGKFIMESKLNPLGVIVKAEGRHFCSLSPRPHSSSPLLVKTIYSDGEFKKAEKISELNLMLKTRV